MSRARVWPGRRLRQELRVHSVALISLAVALSGLAYNTWRNELSEANRTWRTVGIELLLELGALQSLVFQRHYDGDLKAGNLRDGWARVLMIRDLTAALPEPTPASGQALLAAWDAHSGGLGQSQASADVILAQTDVLRAEVVSLLTRLD